MYREKFEGYAPEPPQSVWKNVERRLGWRDFVTFHPLRPNIYYAAAVAGALAYAGYQYGAGQESLSPIAISVPAEPTASISTPHQSQLAASTYTYQQHQTPTETYQQPGYEDSDLPASPDTGAMAPLPPEPGYAAQHQHTGKTPDTAAKASGVMETQTASISHKTESHTPDADMKRHAAADANIRTLGQSAVMEASGNNARLSYAWDFGDGQSAVGQRAAHKYRQPGVYKVRLVAFSKADNICDTIEKEVQIAAPQYSITFPNAQVASLSATPFVPKGDVDELVSYRLVIYRRNGQEVFSTASAQQGWNGFYKGERLSKGVYVYKARYEFSNGERNTSGGSITLLWEDNTNLIIHP